MAQTGDDDERGVAPTDPAESRLEAMADLRPGEPAGWKLARARMLGSLFGGDSTLGTFGRFRVLDRLGAGGMGVVYEAYDPDLARGVALKLVNVAARDRETALAEAKALARLSHPNVVPIYDVGIESDHVYLVMELVRGQTLREWPEQRTLREVLAVYRQAGQALAAAHGVGLVHRDFKPDNAIVGADGRVRVVDFGLACEADDPSQPTGEPRRVAGTPGFIAPEIKAGMAVTPAADQYSFSVALAQALELIGASPPRHVAAAIERGRAADPAQRFPTMAELLRVLERDPARTRRRAAAIGGLAAAVGAGAFFVAWQLRSEADPCDAGAAQLDAAWSPVAREAALNGVIMLGAQGASLRTLLAHELDDYARRWGDQSNAACVDRRRGIESDTLIDRRRTCLDRRADELVAVGKLITEAREADLAELPRAVQSMRDPAECADRELLLLGDERLRKEDAPQLEQVGRHVAQARIDVGAERFEQALTEASAAVTAARRLGYKAILAEALILQGHARMYLPKRAGAVDVLTEAMTLAIAAHQDALEVEAWARRAWALGTSADPVGAQAGLDQIEPVATRTPSLTFGRALLYNNLGSIEIARNRLGKARDYLTRALAESRRTDGPVPLELISILQNLAFVTSDRKRGDALLIEAGDELARRLGPDHPDTLHARMARGFVTVEDLHTAAALLTPTCRAYESQAVVRRAAECWIELGLVRYDLRDRDGATQAMASAVQLQRDAAEAAGYVTLLRGDARRAERQFVEALAAHAPAPDDHWWDDLVRGQLKLGQGRARREAGDLPGACEALEAAVAEIEAVVHDHPQESYERRLGRARVELAFTLSSLGASAEARVPVVDQALAWLRHVGGLPDEIQSLEAMR